jgi:high-affinity nickel-transport protein
VSLGVALSMGFVLGVRHAADADHVAAVATLLRREQGLAGAARVGALWGVGHASVIVAAGAVMTFAGVRISERFAVVAELFVCAMLVALGAVGLHRARRVESLAGESHAHDAHGPHEHGGRSALGALGVGAVHGLAGSAGAALLAASASQGLGAIAFLSLFGAGTIVGMAVTTMALSVPLGRAAKRSTSVYRALLTVASAASALLGLALGASLLRGLAR